MDDEPAIHTLVSAIVSVIGDLEFVSAFNGREALAKARAEVPALIISDVSMPDMDGLTLCRSVREDPALEATPVLLLTARGESQDKYSGFLQGADDYLVKPFDATELQFRIKALLRRSTAVDAAAGLVKDGRLTLDTKRYTALFDGQEIRLTGSEFAILRFLAERPGQVVSVEALLTEAL
ncbi:MAG TPA: response regulator transcription factor, partial [Oscillatoriaceae cyanobacterium]